MKYFLMIAMTGLIQGQVVLATPTIPILGCDKGKIISSDQGNMHCVSTEVPCRGKLIQLNEPEFGSGLTCVKDCFYANRAGGGEALICLDSEEK